jgi:DNA polymerase III subunit epsilon
MAGNGFAVIDVETTGLFPTKHDRIGEIAVVHVSDNGTITDEWETLVNPMRDMGSQHIHGISAAAAARAPVFDAIAPQLLEYTSGRVPVAHNATFDSGFLSHQMALAGGIFPTSDRWMCTMKLARHWLPGGPRRLQDCCSVAGLDPFEGHRALADARASARLLSHDRSFPHTDWWQAWLASAWTLPNIPVQMATAWMPREATEVPAASLLERVAVRVSGVDDNVLNLDYLALLDRVLLDRHISVAEADALVELAADLGVSGQSAEMMHRAYFDGLVSAAWADGEMTADELNDVRAVGTAVSLAAEVIETALEVKAARSPMLSTGFSLTPGDVV